MRSVDSNFNFLCGRPHGTGPPPPVHMRPPEPDPPPPHKWMAPYLLMKYSDLYNYSRLYIGLGLYQLLSVG